MLADQRQHQIRAELARHGSVVASALALRFGVSEDTIRRDLRELSLGGVCHRVYGGAVAPYGGPFLHRVAQAPAQKAALAMGALPLIRPHQTLFIDAGTTNLAIARALLPGMPLTVATNSLAIATVLAAQPQITLILLGGVFDAETGACTGAATVQAIQKISADLVFLGSCGIDITRGATAFDPAEAEVKRAMVAASACVAVAATADKLGTHAPYRVAPPTAISHLITQHSAPADLLAGFRAVGTTLHLA